MQYRATSDSCGLCDAPPVVRFLLTTDDAVGSQILRCAHHWSGTVSPTNLAAAARVGHQLSMVVDLTYVAAMMGPLCDCGLPADHVAGPPNAEAGRRCQRASVTRDELTAGAL
jgi:hypothetical protein